MKAAKEDNIIMFLMLVLSDEHQVSWNVTYHYLSVEYINPIHIQAVYIIGPVRLRNNVAMMSLVILISL